MIRDRNEKRSVIFLVFAAIFFLGFISFTLDLPPGLTVYEFVNEEANQTNNVLITNEIAEQIVNETLIKDVNETSLTILEEKPLHRVVIGQPVRWIKKILPNETTTAVDINIEASNITVRKTLDGKEYQVISDNIIVEDTLGANSITGAAVLASGDGFFSNLFRGLLSITGLAIVEEPEEETKRITILEEADELEIEYTLPGPEVIEETISSGKKITVYSELNYTDILSYMTIEETLLENVKLYHVTSDGRELVDAVFLDTNDNNLIDYIEWNIPHLSNQTYEAIIEISNAIHLDSNRDPINNIYDEVKTLDNVWSEQINTNEFVRVNFTSKLDNTRDITVYARNNDSYNAYLEFYIYNSSTAFAQSSLINEEGYYRTLLTNLTGLHSEFDIKVVSNQNTFLEFNHIIDPIPFPVSNWTNLSKTDTGDWVGSILDLKSVAVSSADNLVYTGITSGGFGVYNSTSNVWTNLSTTDTSNWVSTSAVNSVTVSSVDGLVYTAIFGGKFGVYNSTSNVWTDLSATDTGNWVGTSAVFGVAVSSADNLVYTAIEDGKLGVYNSTSNVWTNLSTTDAGNWVGTLD